MESNDFGCFAIWMVFNNVTTVALTYIAAEELPFSSCSFYNVVLCDDTLQSCMCLQAFGSKLLLMSYSFSFVQSSVCICTELSQ